MVFQKNNLKYFNGIANRYDSVLRIPIISTIRSNEEKEIKKAIDGAINTDDVVLDLGCGTGYYTFYLAKRCSKVIANDISEAMINIAKVKQIKEDCYNIEWKTGEIGNIDIGEKINKILCIGVLDYLKNPHELLSECRNATDGEIIISAPRKSIFSLLMKIIYLFSCNEYRDYTIDELNNLLEESGFQNARTIECGLLNRTTLIAIASKR